jgi:hypothetical protein
MWLSGVDMQPLRKSEFWEDTIKKAGRDAAKLQVKHAYRPVGFLITVSILVFLQLSDMGMPLPAAVLVTLLVALLTLMFS